MPPQQQGGGSDQGQGLDLLWGAAFIILATLAIWHFLRGPILFVILHIKLFEIQLISFFTNSLDPLRATMTPYLHMPTSITITQLAQWFHAIGVPMRYVIAGILGILGALLYFTHPNLKFNHVFDMQRLRELEKINWPQITPVVKEDLLKEDIDEGKWAMSLSPMQFAKKYQLLEEIAPDASIRPHLRKRIEVRVKKDRAEQLFAKQLGPVWRGAQKAPPHARALLAIFAAHANHDKGSVTLLTAQIAQSSEKDALDFSHADDILKKYYDSKPMQQAIQSHAYLYGVMAALLEIARTSGVLSSSDFLWLKPYDRPMWYVINTVGRRTAMSEIAGFQSHFLAEKALGRKLTQPMVKNAVAGLELAIKDIIYTPDETPKTKG